MTGSWRRVALAATMLAIGCGGDTATRPLPGDPTVRLTVAASQLAEGESTAATVLDAAGKPLPSASVQWQSSDASIVAVAQDGTVRAMAAGEAWIRAQYGSRMDSVRVTVARTAVASVELDVERASVAEGATRQLVALVKGPAGQTLSGRGLVWRTSDAGIAQVGALGLVTAIRPGTATVTVTVEGKSDVVTLIVSADYDYDLLYDAWSGVPGEPSQLYRLDLRAPGGMPARVIPGLGAINAAVSPDGRRIAFTSLVNGWLKIFLANADGTGVTRITTGNVDDDEPVWSPDGTQIAFQRWDTSPGGQADIVVMNADGSGQQVLTADHGRTNQSGPAWSDQPNGRPFIVYSSQTNDASGQAHLWRMRPDGSEKVQLTAGEVWDDQPTFSPDGRTVAFQRHGIGVFGDLYLIDIWGGSPRALVGAALANGQFAPAWSPDGRMIAFASKHDGEGRYQIYTVWADGSKLARRTFDATDKQRPSWAKRLE
jgi:Tol biopolymer transport system component